MNYIVLDRKPRNKEFQFYSGNFKRLKLLDVFNPKSKIRNPKSCLNGLFVQALYSTLSNYLSFRHFFVHSYSFTLKWDELKPLVDDLNETLKKFKSAIYNLIDKHD